MAPVSLTSPVMQSYMFYSAVLALKVLFMVVLTGMNRFRRGVFANPEDVKKMPKAKVKYDDPDVERVRRAHLNDLENIPIFWLLGALYVTTGPAVAWATLLFRIFTAGRIVHTVVYAIVPMQPARAIAFGIPFLVNVYMGVQVMMYYASAL